MKRVAVGLVCVVGGLVGALIAVESSRPDPWLLVACCCLIVGGYLTWTE